MKWLKYLSLIPIFIFTTSCSSGETNRRQYIEIETPSLQQSVLKNPSHQKLSVFLPDNYFESKQRYPVIYYFHGYGGNEKEAGYIAGDIYEDLMAHKKAKKMIIVGINGNNHFGGSFFANSPVTGQWEDFVTEDVVSYIDGHYRTKPVAESRGLAGYSMGGYSAINIGFKHADKFKYMFSLSPGLVTETGLLDAVKQWKSEGWTDFLDGYAATFAPNMSSETNKKWFAWDSGSTEVQAKWASGFGDIANKVKAYKAQKEQLNSIHIEYGRDDMFAWIPEGSHQLVKLLKENKIEVTEVDHQGGHELRNRQITDIITFFSSSFSRNGG